ncbi:lysylphosphatidylglycerol synthase domain-containing protein [Caballeronia ptereochthonis]|uniref:Membrane protein n=1 Tax=Caballeronia ptereochthonis TaxID=1777144 RepID=A0A158DTJ0_9BURK|nr:lysylphosphatidylglycerol synthase domain-containing protein [Caballeronia ptereochthonis]SAK97888.1 membrane protein [Caballeronia ptereochthonis]
MMSALKRLAWLRWPAAIALLVALALHEGVSDAFALIARTGPVLLWLVPLHALPLLFDARAWHLLIDERVPLPALWWIAVVREAVGRLLPVLGIGGELAGIRLATRYMPDVSRVSASVIVELLVTIAVQFALAMLGLALLRFHASDAGGIVGMIGVGLIVSLPIALAAFVVAHKGAPFHRLEGMARRWLDPAHALAARLDGKRLDHDIRALLQRIPLLARAFAWQFAGYVLGATEIYAALDMLGHPVSIAGAVTIEALVQAVRNAVFIAPAGLGVQEAAIVAIAATFGVDRDAALSLAMLRRVREFAWGGIALVLLRLTEPSRASGLARERG